VATICLDSGSIFTGTILTRREFLKAGKKNAENVCWIDLIVWNIMCAGRNSLKRRIQVGAQSKKYVITF